MIHNGLVIMAVGMLMVFAFLSIMVITIRRLSGFILKYFPETEETASGQSRTVDAEIAVAVAVACTRK